MLDKRGGGAEPWYEMSSNALLEYVESLRIDVHDCGYHYVDSWRVDDSVLIESVDNLFNFSKINFNGYNDQRLFGVIWIISYQERIWNLIFHSGHPFGLRARCVVGIVSLFKDTVLPRAQNPNSMVNLVCSGFFERVWRTASFRPHSVAQSDLFMILDSVMHCLSGHHGVLDNGIHYVLDKWYPES